ncbi:MAG TPA: alkaline phosphatase, partial [Paludibacteraceae bacterium]|nr:alkaline phosphatase [Paludibacteraceae bacterium]
MKKNISIGIMIFIFLVINSSAFGQQRPKNIIIMIGDGMGLPQIYTAMVANNNHLALEDCTYSGFSKTYSADHFTTDSGAGGTAIACGIKTKNGMIGMGPDSVKVTSILEISEQNQLSTGIVVACAVTDATPATFIAHQV